MSELISVIVPVYNVEGYVQKCLESIAAQTYTNFECIIIDDGSTNRSGEICDAFCAGDSRFRVIHQQNQGLGFARNTGLDNARGDYIQFVDSDDWIRHDTFETALRLISSGPYDWVAYEYDRVDDNGKQIASSPGKRYASHSLTGEYAAFAMLMRSSAMFFPLTLAWNKLYRKAVIQDLRFDFDSYAEDTCFNFRVFQKTRRALISSIVLYHWRNRKGIISNCTITGRQDYLRFIHELTLEKATLPGDSSLFRASFLSRIFRTMDSTRYHLIGTSFYDDFMQRSRRLRKSLLREFLHHKCIPSLDKALAVSSWLFPHLGQIIFKLLGN